MYDAIMEAGQEFGVKPTGPSDIRRIEGAIFNWNADMNYDNNPLEMGLERLVAWDLPDEASISLKALWVRPSGISISVSSTVWRWRTARPIETRCG